MLTRPADLQDLAVIESLRTGWGVESVSARYLAVGFGSHHWEVADDAGRRWFVSVDDLAMRRRASDDSPNDAFIRLRAALLTSSALRDSGAGFVVAPIRATNGDVVCRIGDQYAVALYPFVDARFRNFDDRLTDVERDQVLRLIAELHTASAAISGAALVENFVLAQRDEIVLAFEGLGTPWDTGPYGERARSWFTAHASRIEEMLREHDQRADQARQRPDRMVLTHGEPHPGNLLEIPNGWMLVDWDTALVAPPERDLWDVRGAEQSTFEAYTSITGHDVLAAMLDFYRLAWELDDIASLAARFRRAHDDTADAREEWANMQYRSL